VRRTNILMIGLLLAACGQRDAAESNSVPANEVGQANLVAAPLAEDNVVAEAVLTDGATPSSASPCRLQDGKEIGQNRMKAVGTEPFWSADVDGRCVTYSTPENQKGIRIWTRFSGTRETGEWSGSLGKDRFILATRPDAGCSDGMSDRTYPIAVTLKIGGDERRGCAGLE
jgi:uncharacterized membrane protein